MKKWIQMAAFFVLTVSSAGLADTFSASYVHHKLDFFYSSRWSYFSCSYVEGRAPAVLKMLGAKNVKVWCSGGPRVQRFINAYIEFDSLVLDARGTMVGSFKPVVIKGRDACSFNEQLIDQLLKKFSTMHLSRSTSCWNSEGPYKFSADVLQ